MIYLLYLVLAVIVVGVSIKISYYVDLIDKTTNISGAFIGGVMLAAVTSLPEFFTSLSATLFLNKSDLVIGNILGSNIFNLAVLAVLIVLTYKKFDSSFIAKSHTKVANWLIFTYVILSLPIFFNKDITILGISGVSIALAVIYILCIKYMATDTNDSEDDTATFTDLSIQQIFIRFTILSVVLVIASIGITYVTDIVAAKLNLDVTLAGALLLGIATSLPEVASCIALAKIGNFNAMVGNILGSNIFNLSILFLADILHRNGTIYTANVQSYNLIVFGVISTIAIMIILKIKGLKEISSAKISQSVYVYGGFVSIIGYILFLTLS